MSRPTPRRSLLAVVLAASALATAAIVASATAAQAIPIQPRVATTVTVSCEPGTVYAGQSVYCRVLVNGTATARPQGVVTFTSSRGDGFFTPYCTLVANTAAGAPVNQATCAAQYTPTGVGSATRKDYITAKYGHQRVYSTEFRPGSGQTQVSVLAADANKVLPTISIACGIGPVPAGSPVSCGVFVQATSPSGPAPTGSVTFKSSRPKGMNPGNSTCTLSPPDFPNPDPTSLPTSQCGMTYIPPDAGYPTRYDTITATYQGDSTYGKAIASVTFNVPKAGAAA